MLKKFACLPLQIVVRSMTKFLKKTDVPTHFIERFDDKTSCCKICAASAHRGAKNKNVNVCCDWQEELKNDPQFLTKVVTGDESWCYGYDSGSKQQ